MCMTMECRLVRKCKAYACTHASLSQCLADFFDVQQTTFTDPFHRGRTALHDLKAIASC